MGKVAVAIGVVLCLCAVFTAIFGPFNMATLPIIAGLATIGVLLVIGGGIAERRTRPVRTIFGNSRRVR